ncbi:MAG: hypothetical protein ABI861_12345, partial [Panacibacter sp.]
MKPLLNLLLLALLSPYYSFAGNDTTNIPLNRQVFHDKVVDEQKRADRADGRLDGIIKVSPNNEINLQVTDAIIRKVNVIRNDIEGNKLLPTNNDKIRYLRYLENLVRDFTNDWRAHKFVPSLAPQLVDNFSEIMALNLKGESMAPLIQNVPYEVGMINNEIFEDNPGYDESKIILFRKFCKLNPDKILANLGPYVNLPFADSLVIDAFNNNPSQLYSYAQSSNSRQGRLIKKIEDPRVKTVVRLSTLNRALFYFPFLDNLISGKKTIEEISKFAGTTDNKYDSVGYYKLLVSTEMDYYRRLTKGDTPVAMLGSNGLVDMLQTKAIQHFIEPINNLHENPNLNVRFRAIEPLS